MAKIIKWGILGSGAIAHLFAEGLKTLADTELVAVASKTPGKAAAFAEKHNVPLFYDNYEGLVKNPDIDVIYVATTHNFHYENTMLCLENNKNVLCEKAFTINAQQAEKLIAAAREKKLFLMEAMWTRFIPCIKELNKILDAGTIGDIKFLRADFGFKAKPDPEGRLLNPKLAGGSLLDIGIYPISFSRMVFKKPPMRMESSAVIGKTGVDEHVGYLFEYDNGEKALLSTSLQVTVPFDALIAGTKGYIKLHDFFYPKEMTIKLEGEEEKLIECGFESTGYNYEAEEVNGCLREGKIESPIMPLDESLELMRTMDTLRMEWGMKYPEEE